MFCGFLRNEGSFSILKTFLEYLSNKPHFLSVYWCNNPHGMLRGRTDGCQIDFEILFPFYKL